MGPGHTSNTYRSIPTPVSTVANIRLAEICLPGMAHVETARLAGQ